MDTLTVCRTTLFRWESKYDLYRYFKRHYNLDQSAIDSEIYQVMSSFRPRKWQSIHTKELWQKVGMNLEKKCEKVEVEGPIDNDLGVFDSVMVNDEDPNATRKMDAIDDEQYLEFSLLNLESMIFSRKSTRYKN